MEDFKPILVTDQPLDPTVCRRAVANIEAGAVLVFEGTTRLRSRGKEIDVLEYEAYEPMAVKELQKLADEMKSKHGLLGICIHHRLGLVDLGETSLVVALSSAHRKQAFRALDECIDMLKQTVPIWKKEVWKDGEEWIGSVDS